jgi:hypothetical protein
MLDPKGRMISRVEHKKYEYMSDRLGGMSVKEGGGGGD